MTKYDYYVEYVEGIARAKGSSKPPAELPKPRIRLVQGANPPTSDDSHALVSLPNVVDEPREQVHVLLAGALSKNPDVLEKLSQLKSTLSETYFSKKSDDKEKKPILNDTKSDSKSSDKKAKKSSHKSESESDSDEPTVKTPKRKMRQHDTLLLSSKI